MRNTGSSIIYPANFDMSEVFTKDEEREETAITGEKAIIAMTNRLPDLKVSFVSQLLQWKCES
ncbi:MAG: hypothetical protein GXO47_04035 [Chlorobi bacterium]|nr:hypothetical protein [Chlorobiota bacterium]